MNTPQVATVEEIQKLLIEMETADDCLFCYPEPIGRKHEQTCSFKKIIAYARSLEQDKNMLLKTVKATAEGALLHSDENKRLRDDCFRLQNIVTDQLKELSRTRICPHCNKILPTLRL